MNIVFKECHRIMHKDFPVPLLFWDMELQNFDIDSLLPELTRNDIWTSKGVIPGRNQHNGDSVILSEFLQSTEQFKIGFLDTVYNYDHNTFNERWWKSLDYYKDATHWNPFIFKDPPNFRMGKHYDNSHVVVQMIINLVDNTNGTHFHNPTTGEIMHTSSGKKGEGVLFFNNAGSPHSITNGDQTRYIFYANIEFP